VKSTDWTVEGSLGTLQRGDELVHRRMPADS